jgi:glutamine synthetase
MTTPEWFEIAAVDIEGRLRAKLVSRKSFQSAVDHGIGFSSIIYATDCKEARYENVASGPINPAMYGDMLAVLAVDSARNVPWLENRKLYLVWPAHCQHS